MSTLDIILIIVAVLIVLLAIAGFIVVRRRREETQPQFLAEVAQVNQDLAAAHAADNGWEPGHVEAAARRAFTDRRPGATITALALVQVVDPPGTDDDKAVFRVEGPDGSHRLTLGRRGGEWIFEELS